jgi:hypothetical protein
MQQETTFNSLMLGFLAGVIAVITVHELISLALLNAGAFGRVPWSMEPALVTGIPQIASDAIWGGIWGAIFAVILGAKPKGSMTLRGALLGIVGPALLGVFLLVPFLRGEGMFLGGDLNAVVAVLMIATGFGAATAWLYGFFTAGFRLP